MAKISVLILTQNSGRSLERTLESVKGFDEIIIIDGGSSDNTEEIAKRYSNAKFIFNGWPGFIVQRNYSIDQASNEWCFMIDSDEACTPELTEELHRISDIEDALPLYRVMRTEFFIGQKIERGHGKSDYQERLFKKSRVKYGGGNHHEHYIDGEYAHVKHPLMGSVDPSLRVLHDEEYGMEEWVKKLPRFIVLIGNEKYKKGKRVSAFEVIFEFFFSFFKVWIKSLRAGRIGFIVSASTALHRSLIKLFIYQKQHYGNEMSSDFEKQRLG